MRVYLAHSIANTGDFNDSKRIAERIRELGYEVYVASENTSINDKSNEPTPKDIYEGDVSEILKCDIFVPALNGSLQDGTISEVGVVAGLNEMKVKFGESPIHMAAFTTNARLQQPQFYRGIPSAGANHLVLGMIDKWGVWCGSEEDMLNELDMLLSDRMADHVNGNVQTSEFYHEADRFAEDGDIIKILSPLDIAGEHALVEQMEFSWNLPTGRVSITHPETMDRIVLNPGDYVVLKDNVLPQEVVDTEESVTQDKSNDEHTDHTNLTSKVTVDKLNALETVVESLLHEHYDNIEKINNLSEEHNNLHSNWSDSLNQIIEIFVDVSSDLGRLGSDIALLDEQVEYLQEVKETGSNINQDDIEHYEMIQKAKADFFNSLRERK